MRIPSWVLQLIAYLVGVAVLVGMTLMEHKPSQPADTAEGARPDFWSTDFWYEGVVGAPDPRDRHVAVVTVGKDMQKEFPLTGTDTNTEHQKGAKNGTPPLPDACRRRLYITQLLKILANFYPKVVVLDVWFDPELCSDKQTIGTLSDELRQFSKQAPIILGVPSRNAADLQAESPADFAYMRNRNPALKSTDLVLMPVVQLPQYPDERLTVAVIRRDSDARRIPLSWPVYDDFPDVGSNAEPKRKDTLSVAAVRAFDPHHPVLKTIDALNSDGSARISTDAYPYTSFLREDQFQIARAIDVICSSPPNELWKTVCAQTRILRVTPEMFRDKIVVIGLAGLGGDLHQTVLGKAPGLFLQANYIESLLSNRVYKPLSLCADLLFGFVWLGAVFTIAWRVRSHPFWALTLSLLATVVPAYLILKMLIWCGYYTELLIPLAVAAIVTNVTVQFHHFLLHEGGGS
jgi:CHASE2 domain-containing sensor protein